MSTPILDLKIASSRCYTVLHGALGLLVLVALVHIAAGVSPWPALLLTVPAWELWLHTRRQSLEGAVLRLAPKHWQLSIAGQRVYVRPSGRTTVLPFCVRLILLEDRGGDSPGQTRRWSGLVFNDSTDVLALRALRRQLNLQPSAEAS